jgi:hypothetical protein
MVRRKVKRLSSLEGAARKPATAPPDDDLDPARGPGWLLEQAADRTPDRPLRITIERLIAFWQARTLSNTMVQRIEEELEGRGLVIEPGLRGLESSTVVELRKAGQEAVGESGSIGYSIGDIPAAKDGLYCVYGHEPVTAMFDEMLRSKRDHIGVTDETDELIGYANWIEVCSEMQDSPLTPASKVARRAREVHASEKLFSLTSEILKNGFVCVFDDSGAVTGSVNCADITAEHERRMYPLSLIEEIERRLRSRISVNVQVRYGRGRGRSSSRTKQRDELTFGDYMYLIKDDENFKQMGWGMPSSRLHKAVNRARIIRNAVFHHRAGRPNQEDVTELEALLRSLEGFDSSSSRDRRKPDEGSG